MIVDLHTHTTASDGKLTTSDLVLRAMKYRLNMLSITDHDTVAGYTTMPDFDKGQLIIIPGIEFSTSWKNIEIHVLGLNIQPDNSAIIEGVSKQSELRWDRAEKIARKLQKLGINGALEGAGNKSKNRNIGRPHFAEYLVEIGFVKDINQAFSKYLSPGKPCYIRQNWASLKQVVAWINTAGGVAVLAHPARYKLTRTKLLELLGDFIKCGGGGMEVITGKSSSVLTSHLTSVCKKMGLKASCGSDFHQPGQPWSEIGQFPRLPEQCIPVWDNW